MLYLVRRRLVSRVNQFIAQTDRWLCKIAHFEPAVSDHGIAENIRALQKVYRAVERYWRKMLCTRSWAGCVTWATFNNVKTRTALLGPKLFLPYRELQALAVL